MVLRYKNRKEAGEHLGRELARLGLSDSLILALPRGGVPVGYEVSKILGAPLDTIVARKIGMPENPEYALGAVSGGSLYLNEEVIKQEDIPKNLVDKQIQKARNEAKERADRYKSGTYTTDLSPEAVILVDDGLATGSTAKAAILEAKKIYKPKRTILAVPVCPLDTHPVFADDVDEYICLNQKRKFNAVGLWYEDFGEASHEEVVTLLDRARSEHGKQ